MKTIKDKHRGMATFLSFALIPLSGFATDIYLPSLPSMTASLHASNAQVQLSLMLFLISAGISQLFVGSLLDSFGRFNLSNGALLIFSISCFIIALYPDLYVLYAMRCIQGVAVALIIVAKRAYFLDMFSGDQLKKYTSLFSIIWATAPIMAPFLGGYLQEAFGWQSNFYFLGILTLIALGLTIYYGGESLKQFHPFEVKAIFQVYASMIKTKDFALGLMIIGLNYSMVMIFGMTSPFIIEHVWNRSPVVTGYTALLSGVAILLGGVAAKSTITKPLDRKIAVAIGFQFTIALLMITSSWLYVSNIYVMTIFVMFLHMLVGFVFNNLFVYSLGRFSRNAGIVSGLTGGGYYVITSIFSYGTVNLLAVKNQTMLGFAYLVPIIGIAIMFAYFRRERMQPQARHKYELS